MAEAFSALFLLAGCSFVLIAGIGIVRLPDTMCRAHALSKALTFGVMLILFALLSAITSYATWIKILVAILFQCITIPISGHVFALYAQRSKKKQ